MAEFTTDQIFQSRDDMTKWAKSIGLKNGFVIVIDKSANKIGNKLPKCTLICDRDLALLSSIADVFSSAHHILCIWHINQNVMKNCSNILGADWEIFNSAWQKVYTASSIEYFEQTWQKLLCDFMSYPKAIEYLWYTWLAPYKERFVHVWTNNYMHLGCRTSQRVESAHARLKKYLENTMSTIDVLVRKIDKLLILQFGNIKKSFERSIIMRFHAYNDEIYSDLRGHVSIEALEHIDEQLHIVQVCNRGEI